MVPVQNSLLLINALQQAGVSYECHLYPTGAQDVYKRQEKLFYLTAKTITRSVAEEAFAILRRGGLYFNTVTITAKMCIRDRDN